MILKAVSQLRNGFADSLNRVIYQRERIILERHGKPIAAILPFEEFERVKPYLADAEQGLRRGGEPPETSR